MNTMLRYSIGVAVTGNTCAADWAFGDFERQIDRFAMGPAWDWFAERAASLETDLEANGGFDERIAEQLEATGTVFGLAEPIERHMQADELCSQIEEVAMAFSVTLQTRLNAFRVAAVRVYEKARSDDLLTVHVPSKWELFPTDLRAIWHVANFVKHSDEWGTELDKQQRATFEALVELGVANGTHDDRHLARWPTLEALLTLSETTWLRDAIPGALKLCAARGRDIAARIQSDFAQFSDGIALARSNSRRVMLEQMKRERE